LTTPSSDVNIIEAVECLSRCNMRQRRQRGSARGQMQEFAAGKFHSVPSLNAGDATLHSALMLAALMIGHHFSNSAL
jgi:hypothetical protein